MAIKLSIVYYSILYQSLLCYFLSLSAGGTINVMTDKGEIQGFTQKVNGKTVYTFLGIPYAKPPINDLRFADTIEHDSWKGIKMTKKMPNACYQSRNDSNDFNLYYSQMWLSTNVMLSEDCLYLNIWTVKKKNRNHVKKHEKEKNLPVMVWIHGGGFNRGSISPEVLNGAYLSGYNDVVVVTIQYRLGIFGQLITNVNGYSGNQGFKDQITAIGWVKRNIEEFGGSKDKITLFGNDAGATSILLMSQSHKDTDLFQQVIIQSPTLATRKNPKLLSTLTSGLGCPKFSPTINNNYLQCLRSIHPENLVFSERQAALLHGSNKRHERKIFDTTSQFYKYRNDVGESLLTIFNPDIETKSTSNGFRTMFGYTRDEGSLEMINRLPEFFKDELGFPTVHKISLSQRDVYDLLKGFLLPSSLIKDIALQYIALEYDLLEGSPEEIFQKLNHLIGDLHVKCNINGLARNDKRVTQFHVYSFEHRTTYKEVPKLLGVPRGSEIEYIFGAPFNPVFRQYFYNYTKKEEELSRDMMKLWTNFAATGSPNIDPNVQGDSNYDWKLRDNTNDQIYIYNITSNGKFSTRYSSRSPSRCNLIHSTLDNFIKYNENVCLNASKTGRNMRANQYQNSASVPLRSIIRMGYQILLLPLTHLLIHT